MFNKFATNIIHNNNKLKMQFSDKKINLCSNLLTKQ